jgi:hypothetical protein
VNEHEMREAIRTLNRLFDEATRDGYRIEVDLKDTFLWAPTESRCPLIAVTISRPIKL